MSEATFKVLIVLNFAELIYMIFALLSVFLVVLPVSYVMTQLPRCSVNEFGYRNFFEVYVRRFHSFVWSSLLQ